MFISEFFIINLETIQCVTLRKRLNKKNYINCTVTKNTVMKNFTVTSKGLWHVRLRKQTVWITVCTACPWLKLGKWKPGACNKILTVVCLWLVRVLNTGDFTFSFYVLLYFNVFRTNIYIMYLWHIKLWSSEKLKWFDSTNLFVLDHSPFQPIIKFCQFFFPFLPHWFRSALTMHDLPPLRLCFPPW